MPSLAHFLKSWIVGFCIEGPFYGLEVALFVISLVFLTVHKRSTAVNYPVLVMTCLLFTGATAQFAHDAFGCVSLITFFVGKHDPQTLPVVAQNQFLLMSNIMGTLNNAIGDIVLIYRCWYVWGKRSMVMVLPILLFVAYAISAVLGLYASAQVSSDKLTQDATFVNFINSCNIISLALNILVTLLIAGRLLFMIKRTQKFLPSSHASQYSTAVTLILESGAIFCAAQIVSIVTWTLQYDTALVGLPISQIYCIVPTLIIVRVGLEHSVTEQNGQSTTLALSGRDNRSVSRVLESLQFTRSHPTAGVVNSVSGHDDSELETSKPSGTNASHLTV